jgi:hypothetical protein
MPSALLTTAAGATGREIRDPPLPSSGFDPTKADPLSLEEFWLPSRPDPNLEPELYEHWTQMFAGPLRFVPADSKESPLSGSNSHCRAAGQLETSRNWSGGYVLPHGGKRFTRVVGRWRVPNVHRGTGPNPKSLPFRCSVWIGLDGKKAWTQSMPQVGTLQSIDTDGRSEEPTLWWQWWLRHGASAPHTISGVPVRCGDIVLCSLSLVSATEVRFHVKNKNTGYFATVAVRDPEPVRGTSAEWIVERPADQGLSGGPSDTGPLFPLPDYGTVTFESCAVRAETAIGDGQQQSFPWKPQLIRMVQAVSNPSRTVVVSWPTRHGKPPRALEIRYR